MRQPNQENADYEVKVTSRTIFYLRNSGTQKYLQTRKNYAFNRSNCGRNCPILGQLEVSSSSVDDYYSKWRVSSGFLFDGKHEKLAKEREEIEWVKDFADDVVDSEL